MKGRQPRFSARLISLWLLAALIVIVGTLITRPQPVVNPSYNGKKLSAWLEELSSHYPAEIQTNAVFAIRAIGTNAIPLLLRNLSCKNEEASFFIFLKKQWARKFGGEESLSPVVLRSRAVAGFEALGSLGAPAAPRLRELIRSKGTAIDAARAYGASKTSDAFPLLLDCLDSSDSIERAAGAAGLGELGNLARPAVGKLSDVVANDPDDTVRTYALESLGLIGLVDDVIPVILERLQRDASVKVRSCAGFVLSRLPLRTNQIEQLRIIAETDGSPDTRSIANSALQKLEQIQIKPLKGLSH